MLPPLSDLARALGVATDNPFVRAAAPAVRLHPESGVPDPPLGTSRLGGLPDLPADTPWPVWDAGPHFRAEAAQAREWLGKVTAPAGRSFWTERAARAEAAAAGGPRPLAFLAQLACEDLVLPALPEASDRPPPDTLEGAPTELPLPRAGLLSFFYEVDEQVWGFAPAHAGAWRVLYTPPGVPLERRAPPAGAGLLLPAELRAEPVWTFPALVGAPEGGARHWDDPAWSEARERLLERDPEPWHQVGGHADTIQQDMRVLCALVSGGVYLGTPPPPGPDTDRLAATAPAWRLLFQCASDAQRGLYWGDDGRLYFWIREDDARAGRWDRAWLQLQTT